MEYGTEFRDESRCLIQGLRRECTRHRENNPYGSGAEVPRSRSFRTWEQPSVRDSFVVVAGPLSARLLSMQPRHSEITTRTVSPGAN